MRDQVPGSPLGRGRIDVEVCHESIPGCGGPPPAEMVAGGGFLSVSPIGGTDEWGLFGLGPWIASSDDVSRFYDLTGLHEPGSPFANIGWLDAETGTAVDSRGEFTVEWQRASSQDPDVRIVDFTVRTSGGGAYRFGMAVDPDLGDSPADDRSGYDADRGLVYVFDGSGAVGFQLQSRGANIISAVDQYGARRFAPRLSDDARQVGDASGVRLVSGEDDVQFVISGGAADDTGSWRLIMVRAPTVRLLRRRVDGLLGR